MPHGDACRVIASHARVDTHIDGDHGGEFDGGYIDGSDESSDDGAIAWLGVLSGDASSAPLLGTQAQRQEHSGDLPPIDGCRLAMNASIRMWRVRQCRGVHPTAEELKWRCQNSQSQSIGR